jgi:acyl-CoA thioesterase FadM
VQAEYNGVLDFCRIRWMMRVSDKPRQLLKQVRFANGGVSMFFLKELRFFQAYQVRTRVVSYDRKWIYVGHIFESSNGKKLHALGVARVVVKEKSGKTIPPVEFFERNNITIPPKFEDVQGTASEPLTALLEHLQRASGHAPVPPTPMADDSRKDK